MKFCRNFADIFENVEISNFTNFLIFDSNFERKKRFRGISQNKQKLSFLSKSDKIMKFPEHRIIRRRFRFSFDLWRVQLALKLEWVFFKGAVFAFNSQFLFSEIIQIRKFKSEFFLVILNEKKYIFK